MTNEMKLLRAFIEASGYEIEEICESRIPSGQIIVAHDYKVTKKQSSVQDRISEARMIEQYQALSGRAL